MSIVTPEVERYLSATRARADALLAEMEAQGARDRVPDRGARHRRLLEVLARAAGARRIVEIGTAIGVSTLYLARALPPGGRARELRDRPARHATASGYLGRAGLDVRLDLRLQDALGGPAVARRAVRRGLPGRRQGRVRRLPRRDAAAAPARRPGHRRQRADVRGPVASGRAAGHWTDADIATARDVNRRLVESADLLGTVTPVGDGVGIAVRR
jgi:predicted O-methyltransferase YrrM